MVTTNNNQVNLEQVCSLNIEQSRLLQKPVLILSIFKVTAIMWMQTCSKRLFPLLFIIFKLGRSVCHWVKNDMARLVILTRDYCNQSSLLSNKCFSFGFLRVHFMWICGRIPVDICDCLFCCATWRPGTSTVFKTFNLFQNVSQSCVEPAGGLGVM